MFRNKNFLSAPVVSSAEMREIDRRATEEFGIAVQTLMQNAGNAVANTVQEIAEGMHKENILILCGSGNNGGDGFAAAQVLSGKGFSVKVLILKPLQSIQGAAQENFKQLHKHGIPYTLLPSEPEIEKEVNRADLMVDCLLGTGFKGKLTGLFQKAIELMNASGKPVVAADVPSGLNADSGLAEGACVKAQCTVTMGALKKGFLNERSREWTGEIIVADIGFPEVLFKK